MNFWVRFVTACWTMVVPCLLTIVVAVILAATGRMHAALVTEMVGMFTAIALSWAVIVYREVRSLLRNRRSR